MIGSRRRENLKSRRGGRHEAAACAVGVLRRRRSGMWGAGGSVYSARSIRAARQRQHICLSACWLRLCRPPTAYYNGTSLAITSPVTPYQKCAARRELRAAGAHFFSRISLFCFSQPKFHESLCEIYFQTDCVPQNESRNSRTTNAPDTTTLLRYYGSTGSTVHSLDCALTYHPCELCVLC